MESPQLLPMLEHVEFFRGPACDSLADRLPELGRETAKSRWRDLAVYPFAYPYRTI
jgi:hypothetical protein